MADQDATRSRKKAREEPTPVVKGGPIRFVKGHYKGEVGWYDGAKQPGAKAAKKAKMRYVIVDQDVLVFTRVRVSSIRGNPDETPNNYAEAILQQHEDIQADIIELCEKLASCNLKTNKEILKVFNKELRFARKEILNQAQSKIRYRVVHYGDVEEDEVSTDTSL